jgi:hypothetical protein
VPDEPSFTGPPPFRRLYLDEVVSRAGAFSDELDQDRKELQVQRRGLAGGWLEAAAGWLRAIAGCWCIRSKSAGRLLLARNGAQIGAGLPALPALQTILCLGAKDATANTQEVSAKLYRSLLKEEVTSRRIDTAESPAQVGRRAGS